MEWAFQPSLYLMIWRTYHEVLTIKNDENNKFFSFDAMVDGKQYNKNDGEI